MLTRSAADPADLLSTSHQNAVAPRLGGFHHERPRRSTIPKFWYWMDDAELAAKRATYPADWQIVDPQGPSEGLYSPAEMRRRAGL